MHNSSNVTEKSLKHKAKEEEKFWLLNSEQILTCHKRNGNFMIVFEGSYQTHKVINETIFKILEHVGNGPYQNCHAE
jgi:hypothetical protein